MCRLGLLHLVSALLGVATAGGVGLSYDYYENSCPGVEMMVRKAVVPIFITDPRSPAAFLRLLFHDCQVQGCDASILLDYDGSGREISSEMESGKNMGIRDREAISLIKSLIEIECPGQVSCADVIALAAREAVAYSGGPLISLPLGRKDSMTGSRMRADTELPSPLVGVDGALRLFLAKGMNIEEVVAILGAHTIGAGHCVNIMQRLYNSKEKQKIDYGFNTLLRLKCSTEVLLSNDSFVFSDQTTLVFDNQYYRDVLGGRGLFVVDVGISTDPRTSAIVKRFAEDQVYFFRIFSTAFVKLSSAVVLTEEGNTGQIRRQCDRLN